jgi:hypothetical protein
VNVFISSVRRGLEQERDSLPGLLLALGHHPLRFEDFTAQSVPSREACLRGIDAAEAYVLLLGPNYGARFPETDLSPTQEEYVAAQSKGIPRLVFRKIGVDLDRDQQTFVAEVEAYSTGLFRDSFTDAVDLQAKVAAALRTLPDRAAVLEWLPLQAPVAIEWRPEWAQPRQARDTSDTVLDVYAVPVSGRRLTARQVRDLGDQLAARLRTIGAVAGSVAVDAGSNGAAAWACPTPPDHRGGWDEVRPAVLLGVRIAVTGQRSAWQQLPADRMGTLLDVDDLGSRIAVLLRLLGNLMPAGDGTYAVAVGLTPSAITSVGPISRLGQRSSAQMAGLSQREVRVEPDEAVTASSLGDGADEVGPVLARALIEAFSNQR